MKKLTRVKLINWHRFTNVLIDLENSVLISGENGAGKSTLLDAIQFVVTCSTNYFNKAAHENGKRKLTGYIRCKTGRENRPYERTGEISAHVALEFYEEKRQKYFIVGAVVDSASEGQEKTVRYLMDGERLEGEFILAAVCNGRYYGGGFVPTREARMDDGLLHTILVRAVSRPTFLRLVGAYSRGDGWRYPGIVRCSTAREITIESREGDIVTCLDGESVRGSRVDIRLSERRVGFFGPPGCDPNATAVSRPAAAWVY